MAQSKKAPAKVVDVQNKEDKKKALSTAMAQIEKNGFLAWFRQVLISLIIRSTSIRLVNSLTLYAQ